MSDFLDPNEVKFLVALSKKHYNTNASTSSAWLFRSYELGYQCLICNEVIGNTLGSFDSNMEVIKYHAGIHLIVNNYDKIKAFV